MTRKIIIHKTAIALLTSLALAKLILGNFVFERINAPGLNIGIFPLVFLTLLFPNRYLAGAVRKTQFFALWGAISYGYRFIYGPSDANTLLIWLDIIATVYLLAFLFELALSKATSPRLNVGKWIWILLAVYTGGYLLSEGVVRQQIFSSQLIPIASVSLHSYVFEKKIKPSDILKIMSSITSLVFLYILQARAALGASMIVLAMGCLCQCYLRIRLKCAIIKVASKRVGNFVIPRSAKEIHMNVLILFILYCITLWLAWSPMQTKIGIAEDELSSYLERVESCSHSDRSNKADEFTSFCLDLEEKYTISGDVSIMVRIGSDAEAVRRAVESPGSILLPEVRDNSSRNNPNTSGKYTGRTHNLIIYLIQTLGLPAVLLLFEVHYRYTKEMSSVGTLSPTYFPILVLSIFTLNDINYSLPFLIM
jgi:hypothetical protein